MCNCKYCWNCIECMIICCEECESYVWCSNYECKEIIDEEMYHHCDDCCREKFDIDYCIICEDPFCEKCILDCKKCEESICKGCATDSFCKECIKKIKIEEDKKYREDNNDRWNKMLKDFDKTLIDLGIID